MSGEFQDLRRLRRGVGTVYAAAGLLHWGEMALFLLIATGRIPPVVPPLFWPALLFLHFLVLIFTGSFYLMFSYYRSGIFTYPALVDYIAGIPVFMVAFSLIAMAMYNAAQRHSSAAHFIIGFLPGAFLLAYGIGLRSGRSMGFFAKLPD